MHHVDGLAQDCSDTSAFAMELLQSYAKPSMSIDAKWCSRVRKMARRVRRKTHFLSGIVGINIWKNIARSTLNWFICVWVFKND